MSMHLRFVVLGIGLLAFAPAGRAIEIDGIAARVGSEAILRSDIFDEMRRMGAPDERYVETRNHLIERKLILKAAGEAKLTLQEWVVENRVREIIKKGFDGDRNRLVETLGRQKMSYPEWRARMKDDMIVSAMRYQVVDRYVTASPDEMRREYAENPTRYATDRTMTVSVVTLSPERAGERGAMSEKLAKGKFEDLGPTVYRDAKIEELFHKKLCDRLEKMKKGEVGPWLELDGWSYLMRKDDEKAGKTRTFEEAFDDIEANIKEETAKRLYSEWIDRLKSETFIRVY